MDTKRGIIKRTYILLTVLILTGCYKTTEFPELVPSDSTTLIPPQKQIAGKSVEGRPIMYSGLGQGSDVTFIMAAIHGDEPAGTSLVNYLLEYLNRHPELLLGRKVVILPIANPDGLAKKTRFNANKVDLNRNFFAENRINDANTGPSALSEPEAHIINELILQYNPERIISIHQVVDTGPQGLATLIPTGCIDYDGPGQMLANHIAQYCDLPVKKLGARPGSLGSYAGVELGIPIITFEMQKNDSNLNTEMLWQKYGKALLAAILYPNPIP